MACYLQHHDHDNAATAADYDTTQLPPHSMECNSIILLIEFMYPTIVNEISSPIRYTGYVMQSSVS